MSKVVLGGVERRAILLNAQDLPPASLLKLPSPDPFSGLGFSMDIAPTERRDLSAALLVGMHNLPRLEELETVKSEFPVAAKMLDRWLENWARMIEADPRARLAIAPYLEEQSSYKTEIQWNTRRSTSFNDMMRGKHSGRSGMRHLLNADYYARHLYRKQRNFLHHYVDDAYSFLSLASAEPGMAVLVTSADDVMLLYTGLDNEGFLTFDQLTVSERGEIRKTVRERHEDDGKYWKWKPIAKSMRREVTEAVDHIHASEILLDMANRGHDRAFVKSVQSKCGTWTVDLTGVTTVADALRNLIRDGFDSSDSFLNGLLVQEHVPTTHEQRFFVTNGRIVASVCSDRNLNGTDQREGRFFDERVAVIQEPEVRGGEFERGQTAHEVNRPLAAAFAREARKLVREMRKEGRLHYVVDMGLTARGVLAIEINSFYKSGPYCLDRRRVASAHRSALSAEQVAVALSNVEISQENRAKAQSLVAERAVSGLRRPSRRPPPKDQDVDAPPSQPCDPIAFSSYAVAPPIRASMERFSVPKSRVAKSRVTKTASIPEILSKLDFDAKYQGSLNIKDGTFDSPVTVVCDVSPPLNGPHSPRRRPRLKPDAHAAAEGDG
jgi:hypothetical protein